MYYICYAANKVCIREGNPDAKEEAVMLLEAWRDFEAKCSEFRYEFGHDVAQVCALELHECSTACHIFAGDACINVAWFCLPACLKLWMHLQCGAAQYKQNIANHTTAVARPPSHVSHTIHFCFVCLRGLGNYFKKGNMICSDLCPHLLVCMPISDHTVLAVTLLMLSLSIDA
jgi:hypothetical protein